MAQSWVAFTDETSTRLVADAPVGIDDIEEKDMAVGDVDGDGDDDVVVVRKQPLEARYCGDVPDDAGGRRNTLFLNEGGVLTDRTNEFIPGFLDLTNDRDVALTDLDGDGWLDIVTAPKHGAGVCGEGAGGCFEPNGTPGCNDVECCEAVCAVDPFCCENSWDGLCAGEAIKICGDSVCGDGSCASNENCATCPEDCGECPVVCGEGAGGCFEPNGTPGCNDVECCEAVCAVDPFCCENSWDGICAGEAGDLCSGGGTGNCCEANGTPGCDNEDCQAVVCEVDPFCCEKVWDGICAKLASKICPQCGGGGGIAIIASDPPNNAIDARQPSDPDGSNPSGWNSIMLEFNGDATNVSPDDFVVVPDLPSIPPYALEVDAQGNAVAIMFSDAGSTEPATIPTLAWTTILHIPSGTSVRIGYLPADVNNDKLSNANDVLYLIDVLNGVVDAPPAYQTDSDRSGATNANDVLRVIDLLNGAGAYEPWLGQTLPE